MLHRIGGILSSVFGHRSVEVALETNARLELRYGRDTTAFDRSTKQIHRNGKLVGSMSLVDRIELHRPSNQEGKVNWFVTVYIQGSRQVEVGQITDETEASAVAAKIATITGRPVTVAS